MCEGTFKLRFNNHQKSFRDQKYENDTALAKYVWECRDKEQDIRVSWSIDEKEMWLKEM